MLKDVVIHIGDKQIYCSSVNEFTGDNVKYAFSANGYAFINLNAEDINFIKAHPNHEVAEMFFLTFNTTCALKLRKVDFYIKEIEGESVMSFNEKRSFWYELSEQRIKQVKLNFVMKRK